MIGAVKKIPAILCLMFFANAHAETFSPLIDSARRAIQSGLWDVATLRLEAAAAAPDLPADRVPELRILLVEALIRDRRPDAALAILED